MVLLKDLFSDIRTIISGDFSLHSNRPVSYLTDNSQDCIPGSLFISVSEAAKKGEAYIQDALTRGASIIVADSEVLRQGGWFGDSQAGPLFVGCTHPRLALAKMAARFYSPAPESIVAVTGTNGKSSVTSFVRQLWSDAGFNAACMGTLGLDAPQVDAFPQPSFGLTTPPPVALHKFLQALAQYGVTHVSLEASSHGLDQYRVDGLKLQAAAFTNLSQDHLDYHKDMETYFQAKARLFSEVLPSGSVVVLNADSSYFEALKTICLQHKHEIVDYGIRGKALPLRALEAKGGGQELAFSALGQDIKVFLPLFGRFQAFNALGAVGLALATGAKVDRIAQGLGQLKSVVGRLDFAGKTPKGGQIYVDYAHTPNALEVVLKSVRPHTLGRLIVVFGCGGDRDKAKRPLMGKIATQLADYSIITDDNPRSENPALIRRAILEGCDDNAHLVEIGDRYEAILYACEQAEEGDVVIIAGKGHEQGQIIGHTIVPFDDKSVVEDVVVRMSKV